MKYTTFRAIMLVAGGAVLLGSCVGGTLLCASLSTTSTSASNTATSHTPTSTPVANAVKDGVRPWDARVVRLLQSPAQGDKIKDALGSAAPKVNVYHETAGANWDRAEVDLDRDERWDEKWSVDDGIVKRKVAPADDEQYTLRYRWEGDRWVPDSA